MGWGEAFGYRDAGRHFPRACRAVRLRERGGGGACSISRAGRVGRRGIRPAAAGTVAAAARRERRRSCGCLTGCKDFPTADGRARFVADTVIGRSPRRPSERWPFVLNTGRVRDQWHTMTRTGRVPRLMAHSSEPTLDIHPVDAKRLGLVDGGLAEVESRYGTTVLPVSLSTDQRRGEVFAPIHWTDRFSSAGPIDRLVGPVDRPDLGPARAKGDPGAGDTSGIAMVRHAAAARRIHVERPLLLDSGPAVPWTCVPSRGLAAAAERTRHRSVDRGDARCNRRRPRWSFTPIPVAAPFVMPAFVDGRLDACLFLSRKTTSLPPSEMLAELLGAPIEPEERMCLLSGRRPGDAVIGDAGRTVCACFGVGLQYFARYDCRTTADQRRRNRRGAQRRHELRLLHARAQGHLARRAHWQCWCTLTGSPR